MMTVSQKALLSAAILASFIGGVFLCAAVYFQIRYWTEAGHALRHELLVGVALGLFYGFVALFVSAGLAIALRRVLPRPAYLVLCLPALFVGGTLFVYYIASVWAPLIG